MSLESPNANLFLLCQERLTTKVPELSTVDQDLGQLEHYNIRPAVSFPCCLIDIGATRFSDMQNFTTQLAEGVIVFRLGLVQYSDSGKNTPLQWREKSLQFYELEQKVFKMLHGWSPDGFSKLLRRSSTTEQREDDIRVRVIEFSISYTDESARMVTTTIPRPGVTIGD